MALGEKSTPQTATLTPRQQSLLSQITHDIRTTVSHLCLPKVSALSALDATSVDALKDMYYMINVEDPLNAMPARHHVLSTRTVLVCLLPIVNALHQDPSSKTNPKRLSIPLYQITRVLSVLSMPILPDCVLHRGCDLDAQLMQLRFELAHARSSLHAFVTLLQYYIQRKEEKMLAMAPAEECKLEDARIDNILRFFRNLLSPPRDQVGHHIEGRDAGVHLAMVGALHHADFFATLTLLFSTREDASSQYTDLVFLIADIYSLTYRHSSPRQMYHSYRTSVPLIKAEKTTDDGEDDEQIEIPIVKTIVRRTQTGTSSLRAAIQRERALLGSSRGAGTSSRWTTRHSGTFCVSVKPTQNQNQNQQQTRSNGPSALERNVREQHISKKKFVSAKKAIQSKLSFNPKKQFKESMEVNSQILCLNAAKGRTSRLVADPRSKRAITVRKDMQDEGMSALVKLTSEAVETCFEPFLRELRERIEETKQRSKADETEALIRAQRSFLRIVGSVVGFQREKFGKVYQQKSEEYRSPTAQMHENSMNALLSSDFKIIKTDWKAVEAGIELETFQLVFRVLVEALHELKESGKDDERVKTIEVATFAVLEMMKMLQAMAANRDDDENELVGRDKTKLTPRELALNTLEQLFERESFLNAPADLAKDFSPKAFSFKHLTNIVEVVHAFTTILLDEQELARLQVAKKKRTRPKKTKKVEDSEGEQEDNGLEAKVEKMTEEGKETPEKDKEDGEGMKDISREEVKNDIEGASCENGETGDASNRNSKLRRKRVVEESDRENATSKPKESALVSETNTPAPKLELEGQVDNANSNATEDESALEKQKDDTEKAEDRNVVESSEMDMDMKDLLLADADDENPEPEPPASERPNLSKAQEMLLADAKADAKLSAEGENSGTQKKSKVQEMLRADANAEARKKGEPENMTKAQKLILADANNEGKELEAPQLVATREEIFVDADGNDRGQDNGDNDGENNQGNRRPADDAMDSCDSEEEPETREIESIGIVRRFAHAKALQNLLLPIRAALCDASGLSGATHPIPDGSNSLLSPIVVAKSAHVIAAIWKVAKMRERSVLCGQFFSYSIMHLMGLSLEAAKEDRVLKDSVLERFSGFSRDVTKFFFSWLQINPGLALDMMFVMDKNSCHMYTSSIRQKEIADARNRTGQDSGNDSDISLLDVEPRQELSAEAKTGNGSSKRTGKNSSRLQKKQMRQRRQAERDKIEDDEDVDDIDNLKIGLESESEAPDVSSDDSIPLNLVQQKVQEDKNTEKEAGPEKSEMRRRRRKRPINETFDSSDSEGEVVRRKERRKRTPKKPKKKVVNAKKKKPVKFFSSSDEFSDDFLNITNSPEMIDEDESPKL